MFVHASSDQEVGMNVRYRRTQFSQTQRHELKALLSGRQQHAARKLKRAQILVAADAN
jgi:hypothetical protein